MDQVARKVDRGGTKFPKWAENGELRAGADGKILALGLCERVELRNNNNNGRLADSDWSCLARCEEVRAGRAATLDEGTVAEQRGSAPPTDRFLGGGW